MKFKIVEADSSEPARLLQAWTDGDAGALDTRTPHVYREFRCIAATFMRGERVQHTMQATALVRDIAPHDDLE